MKNILFLGSSVFNGLENYSFVDTLNENKDCNAIKLAVNGTTIAVREGFTNSYYERLLAYSPSVKIDYVFVQVSTNDATQKVDTLKTIEAADKIIEYCKNTFNCGVTFISNHYFKNDAYSNLVNAIKSALVDKYEAVEMIDLYNDTEFNENKKPEYVVDAIHPSITGYKEWYYPKIKSYLL